MGGIWTYRTMGRPIGLLALACCLVATAAAAEKINVNYAGVAIDGYDTVAYFTDGRPVLGDPEYSYQWNDAEWWFSSAAHRDAFAADPGKYAPQYGGFCAFAASKGQMADVDPTAWSIVDGRLYLNNNPRIHNAWLRGAEERIEQADGQWPAIQGGKGH